MEPEVIKESLFANLSKIYRKTGHWQRAGLITPEQRGAILSFERNNARRTTLRNLSGLAFFAIALGLISIVAANWVYIPGSVKIGAHFLLNIAMACTIYRSAEKNYYWWREGATALFFALNLTLIVLIGQVFQLEGKTATALGLWMVISTPALFLYGRSAMNGLGWIIAAVITLGFVLHEWVRYSIDLVQFLSFLAMSLFVPLVLLAAGLSHKLEALRPHWTALFWRTGMLLLIGGATLFSFTWYGNIGHDLARMFNQVEHYTAAYSAMLLICLAAPASVFGFHLWQHKGMGKTADNTGLIFVLVSLGFIIAPLLAMPPKLPFMAALHFMLHWLFLAWIALRIHSDFLLGAAIWLMTLRLIFVYIELFGGLLATGFGLIIGGVLLLVTLRAAAFVYKKLSQSQRKEAGS